MTYDERGRIVAYDERGWGSCSQFGKGLSGREIIYNVSDNGTKAYICRLFNHCDWYVMQGNISEGLPISSSDIRGKHETEDGAKAGLLLLLAALT